MSERYISESRPYQNPVALFQSFPDSGTHAFLYSAIQHDYSGRYSIIARFPVEQLITNQFDDLQTCLNTTSVDTPISAPIGWIGMLAYEVNRHFEELPIAKPSSIQSELIQWVRYRCYYVTDHLEQRALLYYLSTDDRDQFDQLATQTTSAKLNTNIIDIHSNFSDRHYLTAIEQVRDYIRRGDIFEANLTRKYTMKYDSVPDAKHLFQRLCDFSPTHYHAFIRHGETVFMGASPEQFIQVRGSDIISRPMKGTRHRSRNRLEDERLLADLAASEKDRAENLMIVDLVRNDIGRIAKPGTVTVPELFKLESYETVHQMISTVHGELCDAVTISEILRACFPPGSMTGAPKIRAMEIITELEQVERGFYSGVAGIIRFDGDLDLSVNIRSLILQDQTLEFQAGGAIVYDSDPESELEEMRIKLDAIIRTLGIDRKKLST